MARTNKSRIETATRVETVRQLILSGVESTRIVQQVSAQWKVTERQGWNYMAKARELILDVSVPSREYLLAEHIAVRRSIRERARQAKDLQAELRAAQDEAKLFGLYAPERIELDDLRDKPDDELIAEFRAIVDAARARTGAGDSGGT